MNQLLPIRVNNFEGMRVIRAFDQSERELDNFTTVNKDLKKWQLKTGVIASLISPLTFLVVNMTLIAILGKEICKFKLVFCLKVC